jgi:aspartyl-tRNA synthetase
MHKYRTHTCGELRETEIGRQVRLSGWLRNWRDLGGLFFIDLADHYGVTQLVVAPGSRAYDEIIQLPKESVIRIDGLVVARGDNNANTVIPTGSIEVRVSDVELLGRTEPVPFPVFPEGYVPEELRLTYRFLDLRRSKMHANILLRSRVIASIRRRMLALGFVEYQTPTLTASSPEGARDFLVPSRRHPGNFYALPQAPQMFKQLIMVSGFDRYFQIAPCYRDEDARADRSPGEFYQLDLEMSFVTQEDVFTAVETLLSGLFQEFRPERRISPAPFPRLSYDEAMLKYGSDKPDLRNPLKIRDFTSQFATSDFKIFSGKIVRGLTLPGTADRPRSYFDKLNDRAKLEEAAGLTWLTVGPNMTLKGPIAKFLQQSQVPEILSIGKAHPGDSMFFLANTDAIRLGKILGIMRDVAGRELGLIEKDVYKFCWIVDFPMYERGQESNKIEFSHNPFSMPQGGLEALRTQDPLTIKAFQYDIVCNGYELSSGAIRNHQPEIMYKAFEIAGYAQQDVDSRFKALINGLRYGAPPHGGIAPGIDRIVMLLADEPNIREVIMFPMNQTAEDLMMNAPNTVSPQQLKELHIRVVEPSDGKG